MRNCVENRLDMVVSGGSGSGKTTTLNVLANAASPNERIIVIEDSAEIKIPDITSYILRHVPRTWKAKGSIHKDLLRNALRMRPDRLVIGECRGKETLI